MTIFLNDNLVARQQQLGVQRVFRAVTEGLSAAFGTQVLIFSPEVAHDQPARYLRVPRLHPRLHNLAASLAVAWTRPQVYLAPFFGSVPTTAHEVYLVYDMIPERLPHYYPANERGTRRMIRLKRRCLRRATRLIAISQHTANDIMLVYPELDPARIVVAHLGVEPHFFGVHPWLDGPPPTRPYLLYVGLRSRYKNFRRALEAFAAAGLAATHDLRVISSEGGGLDQAERHLIDQLGLTTVVHYQTRVSEAALAAQYQHATALLYPSEYEGFGLPVVEALAAGTLVATAQAASLPEVGGAAAFYFDPLQVASMAATLRRVVDLPPEERARRRAAGQAWAARFSWSAMQATVTATVAELVGTAG
ncbi:MAG: glycosyltransferase family 4 protein [Oscillochloridaceae bacterium umkhey_bin13]